jgi:uncharacterized membrane protein YczE
MTMCNSSLGVWKNTLSICLFVCLFVFLFKKKKIVCLFVFFVLKIKIQNKNKNCARLLFEHDYIVTVVFMSLVYLIC